MFLCSVVWFLVTVTVGDAHSSAPLATMWRASKSFERMRTEPFSMPQSAHAIAELATSAVIPTEARRSAFILCSPVDVGCCGSPDERRRRLPFAVADLIQLRPGT